MQKKPKIVLLDNNDSFTFNWVELLRQTVGVEPIVLGHDFDGEIPEADAYIFSPGPGLPSEKPLMLEVITKFGQQKPILGVCLGHQFIAEYFVAQQYNLGKLNHGLEVEVKTNEDAKIFKGVESSFNAALYHSWAVESESIKKTPLKAIAHYDSTIMALKHTTLPIVGFQFHPESFLTEVGKQLILNWLEGYVYPNMTS